MIKTTGLILVLLGAIGLVLGILGIFGRDLVAMSPYGLAIIGFIFFVSGVSMVKTRRDTDEIKPS